MNRVDGCTVYVALEGMWYQLDPWVFNRLREQSVAEALQDDAVLAAVRETGFGEEIADDIGGSAEDGVRVLVVKIRQHLLGFPPGTIRFGQIDSQAYGHWIENEDGCQVIQVYD